MNALDTGIVAALRHFQARVPNGCWGTRPGLCRAVELHMRERGFSHAAGVLARERLGEVFHALGLDRAYTLEDGCRGLWWRLHDRNLLWEGENRQRRHDLAKRCADWLEARG